MVGRAVRCPPGGSDAANKTRPHQFEVLVRELEAANWRQGTWTEAGNWELLGVVERLSCSSQACCHLRSHLSAPARLVSLVSSGGRALAQGRGHGPSECVQLVTNVGAAPCCPHSQSLEKTRVPTDSEDHGGLSHRFGAQAPGDGGSGNSDPVPRFGATCVFNLSVHFQKPFDTPRWAQRMDCITCSVGALDGFPNGIVGPFHQFSIARTNTWPMRPARGMTSPFSTWGYLQGQSGHGNHWLCVGTEDAEVCKGNSQVHVGHSMAGQWNRQDGQYVFEEADHGCIGVLSLPSFWNCQMECPSTMQRMSSSSSATSSQWERSVCIAYTVPAMVTNLRLIS